MRSGHADGRRVGWDAGRRNRRVGRRPKLGRPMKGVQRDAHLDSSLVAPPRQGRGLAPPPIPVPTCHSRSLSPQTAPCSPDGRSVRDRPSDFSNGQELPTKGSIPEWMGTRFKSCQAAHSLPLGALVLDQFAVVVACWGSRLLRRKISSRRLRWMFAISFKPRRS